MIKKIIALLIICFFTSVTTVYAISNDIEIIGPTEVVVGNNIQLKAEYFVGNDLPEPGESASEISRDDVTNKVNWISSDNTIATVNNKGKVVGIKEGTVTIRAYYKKAERKSSYGITVVNNDSKSNEDLNSMDLIQKYKKPIIIALSTIVVLLFVLIIINKKKQNEFRE